MSKNVEFAQTKEELQERRRGGWLLRKAALACLSSALLLGVGCDRAASEPAPTVAPRSAVAEPEAKVEKGPEAPKSVQSPYDVAERTEEEVEVGLVKACQDGQAANKPLLIEFSAPWCGDCRRLAEMKKEEALQQKLSKIPYFAINIGRFDRHEALLDEFGIRAIANWQIVATTDCSGPVAKWKRLTERTLEPKTGKEKVTAEDLAAWIEAHFEKG